MSVFVCFSPQKKCRTANSCKPGALSSTEGFCYRSCLWLRVIPPQTYDRGDNLALALPWVAGYKSYKSYKSYRHWLVITLTSVASARRGWLTAPLPNLTLRSSQLRVTSVSTFDQLRVTSVSTFDCRTRHSCKVRALSSTVKKILKKLQYTLDFTIFQCYIKCVRCVIMFF